MLVIRSQILFANIGPVYLKSHPDGTRYAALGLPNSHSACCTWAAFAAHSTLSDCSALQWQIPVAVQLLPGILLLLGTIIIPESPRFLVEKGLLSSAEDALSWLRALPREHPDILEEIEELREDAQALKMLDTPERSFFREPLDKSVRKRLLVGVGLMIAQNMVGLNALNYCEFSLRIWLLFLRYLLT